MLYVRMLFTYHVVVFPDVLLRVVQHFGRVSLLDVVVWCIVLQLH